MAFAVSVAGCDDPPSASCADARGVFNGSYEYIQGTCDAFETPTFHIDEADRGLSSKTEIRGADTVTTTITLRGCTITLEQQIADKETGLTMSQLSGDLDVEDESELTGIVRRTEYGEDGKVACDGEFQARFVTQNVVVGGAVQRAQEPM